MLVQIAVGAAVLYSALEIGAFLGKQREFELPKKRKDESSLVVKGSYFQYLFKEPCMECDDQQFRKNVRGFRYSPQTYNLELNCPGHHPERRERWFLDDEDDYESRYPEEPKSCLSRLVTGIDNFVRGHPDDRLEGGSRYSLRGFTRKISNVFRNVVHEYKEAKLDAAYRKKWAARHHQSPLFSDEESDFEDYEPAPTRVRRLFSGSNIGCRVQSPTAPVFGQY